MGTAEHIFWQVMLVLALVALNGFFVAAEFALVRIRVTQLTAMAQKGHRRARLAQHILGHLDPYLSACQLGITLASLALGWVGEPAFVGMLEPVFNALNVGSERVRHVAAVIIGFTLITFLHIVIGEQAPKFVAIKRPVPSSLWVAYPLEWFYRASYPFIWLLNVASLRVLGWLGIEAAGEHGGDHSDDELRLMLAEQGRRHGGSQVGRDLVLNAFDLKHRVVREVMTPRRDIVVLNTTAEIGECLRVAEQSRYSRFPLAEHGNVDHALGVVHFKDLVAMRERARTGADLGPVCRPLIHVPPTARLERLLQLFLDRKLHLALVVDEYGGTVGLVTLENVLEELVGQIQDEFDAEKPRILPQGDGVWELQGTLPLFELAELTGEALEAGEVTTVSGWVTRSLGKFPRRGDRVTLGGFELTVDQLDQLRVARLTLRRRQPVHPADPGGEVPPEGD